MAGVVVGSIATAHPPLDVSMVEAEVLQPWTKGIPARLAGLTVAQLADLGLSVLAEDLPLPVAVLREDHLGNNLAWLTRFCQRAGVSWAPHGKTYMAPQ